MGFGLTKEELVSQLSDRPLTIQAIAEIIEANNKKLQEDVNKAINMSWRMLTNALANDPIR